MYSMFADGKYRSTNITRGEWKALLAGSSLQTGCRKQGFNVKNKQFVDVRLGYTGNEQKTCESTDSYIGIGSYLRKNSYWKRSSYIAGNFASGRYSPDNGDVDTAAMAYLLVR